MKLVKITWRNRNDFYADYKCEHCGKVFEADGYNDDNFFDNVIPNVICPHCGKSSSGETEEEQKKRMKGYVYRLYMPKEKLKNDK